jgi:hypothetical protein
VSRRRALGALVLGALLAGLGAAPAAAQEAGGTVVRRGSITEDLYVAGGRVDVLATVDGDVVAAGGHVSLGERITGDVMAAGVDVTVHGQVEDDVRAAGGYLSLAAEIGGDLTAAGASVGLLPESHVRGKVWVAGNEIDLRGRVGRWVRAVGNTVRIGGEIEGDVEIIARQVEILPTARLGGRLTYRSPAEARVAPGARLLGPVTHQRVELPDVRAAVRSAAWILAGTGVLALAAAGLALVLLFPGATTAAALTIGTDPWRSLALGFALFVAVPAAVVVLMGTVVGFVLGAAVLALHAVWLLVGFLVAATFVGGLATRLPRRGPSRGWAALSLLLGLVVLALLPALPILGVLVVGLCLLGGVGAVALRAYRRPALPAGP